MDKEIILLKVSSALLTLTERQNSRSGYRPGWDNNCPLSVGLKRKCFCICSLNHFSDILTIIFFTFRGSISEVKL